MKPRLATVLPRILSLVIGLTVAPAASGADSAENRQRTTVSAHVYQTLKRAEGLISEKNYGEARKKLDALLADVKKASYEEAAILRTLASVYARQGNYAQAAQALAKSIASKQLTADQERDALFNLAQLYMAAAQYRKASDILAPWLQQGSGANSEAHILLADAYSRQKRYAEAIPHVRKAIRLSQKVPASWHQLLLALTYEQKDYRAAAEVLRELIRRFPRKREYWEQLALTYQQSKQYTKALAIKRLAYRQGHYTSEKELLDLVNLHLYADAPYQGGTLLLREMEQGRIAASAKNWQLLADAWNLAREYDRSIEALKKAADLTGDGELLYRIGQLHVEQENWHEAQRSLSGAIAKGKLKAPGEAHVLLGITHHALGQTELARQDFRRARTFSTSKETADRWLAFIAPAPS